MPYCSVEDVQAVVDTDMEAQEIEDLITEISDFMDNMYDTGSLSTRFKRGLCRRMTQLDVMLKDPNSRTIAEYREDRSIALRILQQNLNEWKKAASSGVTFQVSYEPIDQV